MGVPDGSRDCRIASGAAFGALTTNMTGADLLPTLVVCTGSTIIHPYGGWTKIASGGLAALVCVTPDGGTTRSLQSGGALA